MAKATEPILDVIARPKSSEKTFDQFDAIMQLQWEQMQMQMQHEELKGMGDALKSFASGALPPRSRDPNIIANAPPGTTYQPGLSKSVRLPNLDRKMD